MNKYEELIERLEKLTGPDREMDGLIYGLVEGLERNGGTFQVGEKFQFKHPTLAFRSGPAALYVPDTTVLEYTASLDAALTLARDQHEFMEMLGEAYHTILPPSGSQFATEYNALRTQMVAKFPAIRAALLCALRARTEQEKV